MRLTTMKNSLEVPWKIKHGICMWYMFLFYGFSSVSFTPLALLAGVTIHWQLTYYKQLSQEEQTYPTPHLKTKSVYMLICAYKMTLIEASLKLSINAKAWIQMQH